MWYYHYCVQYVKLIVLCWNFVFLCVWTDICTLYLFYVSEINIYYYYYYYILCWTGYCCVYRRVLTTIYVLYSLFDWLLNACIATGVFCCTLSFVACSLSVGNLQDSSREFHLNAYRFLFGSALSAQLSQQPYAGMSSAIMFFNISILIAMEMFVIFHISFSLAMPAAANPIIALFLHAISSLKGMVVPSTQRSWFPRCVPLPRLGSCSQRPCSSAGSFPSHRSMSGFCFRVWLLAPGISYQFLPSDRCCLRNVGH